MACGFFSIRVRIIEEIFSDTTPKVAPKVAAAQAGAPPPADPEPVQVGPPPYRLEVRKLLANLAAKLIYIFHRPRSLKKVLDCSTGGLVSKAKSWQKQWKSSMKRNDVLPVPSLRSHKSAKHNHSFYTIYLSCTTVY